MPWEGDPDRRLEECEKHRGRQRSRGKSWGISGGKGEAGRAAQERALGQALREFNSATSLRGGVRVVLGKSLSSWEL